jgi:hypothetical protein
VISRCTASVALLLGAAAALWPEAAQAANPQCCLARSGGSCCISAPLHAPTEARPAALFSESFTSILESDAGGPNSSAGGPTLVYDMDADDTLIKTKSDASGMLSLALDSLDMTLMLAAAQPGLPSGYERRYALPQSADFTDDDRPEEWVTVVPKPSVAWLLALSLAVVALRRVPSRFALRKS